MPSGNKPLPEPMLTQISVIRPLWVKNKNDHIDRLVQEKCNPHALARSHVFLALTPWHNKGILLTEICSTNKLKQYILLCIKSRLLGVNQVVVILIWLSGPACRYQDRHFNLSCHISFVSCSNKHKRFPHIYACALSNSCVFHIKHSDTNWNFDNIVIWQDKF